MAPATLPRITISNGEKTVVFQSMMHIASPEFYDDIKNDMQELLKQEYVFFYEGVRPGTEQSMEELGGLLGINISADMYLFFAQVTGLITQETEMFLNILPSTNVDLSTDEIVALAKQDATPPNQLGENEKQFLEQAQLYYP